MVDTGLTSRLVEKKLNLEAITISSLVIKKKTISTYRSLQFETEYGGSAVCGPL